MKHLKCTQCGEAGKTGRFINKCRANKTYWVTIGICSADCSPWTLPFRREWLFLNDKVSHCNYGRPLHNSDNCEHPSNSSTPFAFQEYFMLQLVLELYLKQNRSSES